MRIGRALPYHCYVRAWSGGSGSERGYGGRHNGVLDSVPPCEQVEIGSGASDGTSTPTTAEWQEKLDAAESLTERLRVPLEGSEKIVRLMDKDIFTFPARSRSSEEILLAPGVADNDDDAPRMNVRIATV